ncbi:MAG: Bpu10I family restriction endonuclease [Chloroflexota bacterium]|nr:Bpu10I family restriction endonuclease [Chloroflexota bacterium]MDE2952831.1 Bpu10I family restriction endonuclease [Chloroflexota bacterium]
MIDYPRPHGDKLAALMANAKLPGSDAQRIREALERYEQWRYELIHLEDGLSECLPKAVNLLNAYKYFMDKELIFDSPNDFLYRQKGQLKLDNTVIEEFLPIFIPKILQSDLEGTSLQFGSYSCFAGVYFTSTLPHIEKGGGLKIRQKNQDFVVSRPLFVRASHHKDFADAITTQTNLAYMAAECKTNLDKTMFQEAAATALDLKASVPSAKYFLLCEWLDMTPISSSLTAIDEIIVLRKAKRISSDVRRLFSTAAGRESNRNYFERYLRSNPFREDTLARFANHINRLIRDTPEDEVLKRGHF